jgi:chitinase
MTVPPVAHDYDGVGVDWENCLGDNDRDCGEYYNPPEDPEDPEEPDPSDPPISGAEKQRRLIALITAIRAEMETRDRYGAGTPGLITFPGYAIKTNENDGKPEPYQLQVAGLVDQYNVMSYGIGTTYSGGGWLSWFSGALFGQDGLHPVDISSSVDAYEDSGVPRDRIGIGIGFYGVGFGPGITGPRQPTDDNEIYETYDPSWPTPSSTGSATSTTANGSGTRTSSRSRPRGSSSRRPASAAPSCGRSTTAGCRAPRPTR